MDNLSTVSNAVGLKINYNKSKITRIKDGNQE